MNDRLRTLLGADDLTSLRERLRRFFERELETQPLEAIALKGLAPHEHEAIGRLTGQPPRARHSIRIDVRALDTQLRQAGLAESLRAALEQLDGPIARRRQARLVATGQWRKLRDNPSHPLLARWLQDPRALGVLKRVSASDTARAAQGLQLAAAVLDQLPASGMPRAQLAALTLGDAHALDDARPVATLVLAALRLEAGDALRNREVWARAGILVNELARPALALNLPHTLREGEPPIHRPGEPFFVSLRQLLRAPPPWNVKGRAVFVCENPTIVSIVADRLGADAAALVCTDGMPSAAQRTLLAMLSERGAQLHYHGDFDWPGLSIAAHVFETFGAKPWRMCAADYEAALRTGMEGRHPLLGTPASSPWDSQLNEAMRRHGQAIAEEAVVESLLDDMTAERKAPLRSGSGEAGS